MFDAPNSRATVHYRRNVAINSVSEIRAHEPTIVGRWCVQCGKRAVCTTPMQLCQDHAEQFYMGLLESNRALIAQRRAMDAIDRAMVEVDAAICAVDGTNGGAI